jgi:hypothetical protein
VADEPERLRAAVMLRAACETALERFDDDDSLDSPGMSFRITELCDVLDGYLAEAGRRISRSNGDHAS